MCKERRAVLQKTDMTEGGKVHPCFSINLSKIQLIVAIMVGAVTLIGSIFMAGQYAKAEMSDAADDVFNKALKDFHAVARPAIEKEIREAIDAAIVNHTLAVERPLEKRLDAMDSRLTTLETHAEQGLKNDEHHQELLEEMLRLQRDGGSRGGP